MIGRAGGSGDDGGEGCRGEGGKRSGVGELEGRRTGCVRNGGGWGDRGSGECYWERGGERCGGVKRSGGREYADGVTRSAEREWSRWFNVNSDALLSTPQCIVRDEYTERESGA